MNEVHLRNQFQRKFNTDLKRRLTLLWELVVFMPHDLDLFWCFRNCAERSIDRSVMNMRAISLSFHTASNADFIRTRICAKYLSRVSASRQC